MVKSKRLLAAATALCLLVPLAGAWAEILVTPSEHPETGGWQPDLIGFWVGFHKGQWTQFSFYPSGRYDMMVFESPDLDASGTTATIGKMDIVSSDGYFMSLALDGETSLFRRTESPFVRVKEADEAIAAFVDPELIGTYGGRRGGSYIEWSFRGDGSFAQLTPYEQLEDIGYYIAGSGELAILLKGKILHCAYRRTASYLRLDLPDNESVFLQKKDGRLKQMLVDEPYDFGWAWTEGKLVVARYLGSETEVGIPGAVAFSTVTAIGDGAFRGNKDLKSVTVSPFIVGIGDSAFEGCENLTSVFISAIEGGCRLKTIGEGAFRGCAGLKGLNIADFETNSPHSRFWSIGHSSREGVNIPEGVTGIGARAFEGCAGILSMSIPRSVTAIGEGAFLNCPALTLSVAEGSFAQQYAEKNRIPFVIAGS